MTPVMQTRFGNDPEAPGNCFSACVASILECSLADLPDEVEIIGRLKAEFADKWGGWPDRFKRGKSWGRLWMDTQMECLRRGLVMVEVRGWSLEAPLVGGRQVDPWTIVTGKSPRGDCDHSCVGEGMRIVHDPHPDNAGVAGSDRTYIFFAAIDPEADHCSPRCPIDP